MHVEHRQVSRSHVNQSPVDALLEEFNDMALDSFGREESEIVRSHYTACFATPSHYLAHLNNARTQQLLVDDLTRHLWRIKALNQKIEAAKYIEELLV